MIQVEAPALVNPSCLVGATMEWPEFGIVEGTEMRGVSHYVKVRRPNGTKDTYLASLALISYASDAAVQQVSRVDLETNPYALLGLHVRVHDAGCMEGVVVRYRYPYHFVRQPNRKSLWRVRLYNTEVRVMGRPVVKPTAPTLEPVIEDDGAPETDDEERETDRESAEEVEDDEVAEVEEAGKKRSSPDPAPSSSAAAASSRETPTKVQAVRLELNTPKVQAHWELPMTRNMSVQNVLDILRATPLSEGDEGDEGAFTLPYHPEILLRDLPGDGPKTLTLTRSQRVVFALGGTAFALDLDPRTPIEDVKIRLTERVIVRAHLFRLELGGVMLPEDQHLRDAVKMPQGAPVMIVPLKEADRVRVHTELVRRQVEEEGELARMLHATTFPTNVFDLPRGGLRGEYARRMELVAAAYALLPARTKIWIKLSIKGGEKPWSMAVRDNELVWHVKQRYIDHFRLPRSPCSIVLVANSATLCDWRTVASYDLCPTDSFHVVL